MRCGSTGNWRSDATSTTPRPAILERLTAVALAWGQFIGIASQPLIAEYRRRGSSATYPPPYYLQNMFFRILLLATAVAAQSSTSLWSWRGSDIPGPRSQQSYAPSACNNGGEKGPYAFACPHQMMLSNDMRAAAARDGLNASFLYALAGCATDSECGTCYQVRLKKAEKVWKPNFPLLVVQCINSGFDVMPGQMDLYMGAGGFGYFTALNSDCKTRACNGGTCRDNMYDGNFAAWTDAEFPDPNKCYSGGVKQFDNSTLLRQKCRRLSGNSWQRKDQILYQSCVRSNTAYLHQNFAESQYERVQCPDSLVRVSGIQRSDDTQLKGIIL